MNKRPCWFVTMLAAAMVSGVISVAARAADDQAQIKALEEHLAAAISAKDVDRIMSYYVPDETLLVFDVIPPRQYVGAKAFRKDFEGFVANYPGALKMEFTDVKVTADGKLGFAYYIAHMIGTDKAGKRDEFNFRITDCLRRMKGKWLITHEHVSVPVDLSSGKADLLSKP